MRLQLNRSRLAIVAVLALVALPAHADVGGDVDTTTTMFVEGGGPLSMFVLNPSVNASVRIDDFEVNAAWAADVVTGASVAVVDAPGTTPDAITSATPMSDLRQTVHGGLGFHGDTTRARVGYQYGWENDYRSHTIDASARAELFERNTTLELNYALSLDSVCDALQPREQDPVNRRRLPSSAGCFMAMDRIAHELTSNAIQGSWSQAWSPEVATQLSLSAHALDGFQSNPYRGVWLGRSAAQEHLPDTRVRYAAAASARIFVEPIDGTIGLNVRAYRDTWAVTSVAGEATYDQGFGGGEVSLRGRARFATQTAAAFFSDDYALAPRGAYFTGDRELSAMSSWTFGARLAWDVPPGADGRVIGFLDSLALVAKFDVVLYQFPGFHHALAGVPNDRALFVTLSLDSEI